MYKIRQNLYSIQEKDLFYQLLINVLLTNQLFKSYYLFQCFDFIHNEKKYLHTHQLQIIFVSLFFIH